MGAFISTKTDQNLNWWKMVSTLVSTPIEEKVGNVKNHEGVGVTSFTTPKSIASASRAKKITLQDVHIFLQK